MGIDSGKNRMAKNTSNNRIAIKWIRDRAKKAYIKADCCFICGTAEDLELHHLHSLTILLETWAERKGYDISTDEGVLEVRDEFIEQHHTEIYDMVVTLCNNHHTKLHSVYGKAPLPSSVDRQKRWLDIQKAKAEGSPAPTATEEKRTGLGAFSKFY